MFRKLERKRNGENTFSSHAGSSGKDSSQRELEFLFKGNNLWTFCSCRCELSSIDFISVDIFFQQRLIPLSISKIKIICGIPIPTIKPKSKKKGNNGKLQRRWSWAGLRKYFHNINILISPKMKWTWFRFHRASQEETSYRFHGFNGSKYRQPYAVLLLISSCSS